MTEDLFTAANTPKRSNVPEMSVSELAFSLKRTLEETYGRVRVRGELSGLKLASSGHLYGDLKDEDSCINIVCWKTTVGRLSVRPQDGLDVVITGKMTSYPKNSRYQLVIESMELAGEGALLKMLEDRRKKLAAEGLFDENRKKPLPYLPQVIGVVTSPTGAVIRDIIHRISERFPRHVLVWPVAVQGAGAAEQIAAAIRGFNALDGKTLPRPDLLIVARGGGSLEDLMAFNEESVVRAATSASRASSASWPAVVCSPKNSVAVSGSWCASSRITVLHAGRSSAMPSSRSITSAKHRWWLTTTTSASSASFRASITWHSR